MSGKRQPTDLIKAKGAKHLSQAEEAARRAGEIQVPVPEQPDPPKWLPKRLHEEFAEVAKSLCDIGIYSDLDRDALAQFLVCRNRWIDADKLAARAIRNQDEKLAREWTGVQSSYFRQCRQSAEALGLSITSRCRLVMPQKDEDPEVDEFTAFLRKRAVGAE